jgi:hypothetical protein
VRVPPDVEPGGAIPVALSASQLTSQPGVTIAVGGTGAPDVPCASSADPSAAQFSAAGGIGSISIQAPPGCYWTASARHAWIAFAGSTSGNGNGVLQYAIPLNDSPQPRAGSLRAAGQTIQIIQKGLAIAAPFDDVPASHPFADYVTLMRKYGITSGCSATSYCPDSGVTRGQMAVFLVRAMFGEDFLYPLTPFFEDVPPSHQYFRHIQKMRVLGITSGCTPSRYCPDDPVTRGQMAVFVVRSRLSDEFPHRAAPYFADVPGAHPYSRYVQKMKELGITSGCSATQYCPDAPNSRGQMAVFLIRAYFGL